MADGGMKCYFGFWLGRKTKYNIAHYTAEQGRNSLAFVEFSHRKFK